MGVLNVTPDSFSDGGRFSVAQAAIQHGCLMAAQGAHIIDIGGESTRPGSAAVSTDEELARVIPVIEGLSSRVDVAISIDSTKAAVARAACAAGATIINDISGLTFDTDMAIVTAEAGAALCVMHIRGRPLTMQEDPYYDDPVGEVEAFLSAAVTRATAAGVPREKIIVDPGIGFGKRLSDNVALIRACGAIGARLGLPVLMGVSRKSFLKELTGKAVGERLHGTSAAVTACVLAGARVVRVHDVSAMRDVVLVANALKDAGGSIGQAFRDRRDTG